MGTSQSSPGSAKNSPLVPSWANDPALPLPQPEPARFKQFRQSLGRFVGTRNGNDLREALGHYARRSSGGGNTASRRMSSVAKAGANLHGFLTGSGEFTAEATFNLNSLSGQSCELAIAAIVKGLTPEDGDADKIQVAMNQALVMALDGIEVFDPAHITDDVIVNTLIFFIAESVFIQVTLEGGKAWNKASTPPERMAAENDLRELIKVVVDQHMAPKFTRSARSFSRNEIIQLEQQVIVDVWTEWEGYV